MKDYWAVLAEIVEHPAIQANRVTRIGDGPKLRGTNLVTPNWACVVRDEEGDPAEITFACDMMPLSPDPIYGVTYAMPDSTDRRLVDKNGSVHSIDELVAKLFPSGVTT